MRRVQGGFTPAGALLGLALLVAPAAAGAQGFSAGSDGSYGAINVPAGQTVTLDMPADGIFHCTTINVAGTLRFNKNPLNTPVHLLATGDIVVASGGHIDVSGKPGTSQVGGEGGPGGFAGGFPDLLGQAPSPGRGPGAGPAGTSDCSHTTGAGPGAYASRYIHYPRTGEVYGSPLLIPMVGGSGGGGQESPGTATGSGGGGGGGALLLASDTRIELVGTLSARGGGGGCNEGSGGAIRLVSPVVTGTGYIYVNGGGSGYGGHGRIRIDTVLRKNLIGLGFSPTEAVSLGSFLRVFAPDAPRLDLTQVAGQAIPVGTGEPVSMLLPLGSSPNQNVVVQGTNFTGTVPIRVVLTPESGPATRYDVDLNMGAGSTASVTVPVVFPVNVVTQVEAWTR